MGRPREFDADDALQTALELFWRKGYEGTSITDLTDSMGITKPSLYGTFGNKEELFRMALERYEQNYMAFFWKALELPDARSVARAVLYGFADAQTCEYNPSGCLGVNAAMACSDAAEAIQKTIIEKRQMGQKALARRFERSKREGDLPADCNAEDLARYLLTVSQGTAVQAASGSNREEIHRLVDIAMRAWPGSN
ncbi:TetR/AcrR family transcriptional regulator [Phyllobacterium sp. 21LDTY02-6]|jgi:AcrR family transcriptional regulator|uniref:TetR/AcrR family transcriptional regulator n=1 Tax=unclassified Phyllobacterium TaxID=2638441 RepID=UPI0020203065|nr:MULTISPECIES: TetR/AcrR family transcriptional regulator [unclassified Phyllobacterium]MCO4319840.1 TetR/AcrR family transcriptional regulator [Phyllobacterium sp. 21LDTY02-6]MCX8280580.1 TetR/AcrR family transcriptional regulator [Phyllobacterium sp. 0TCS1.6C]MCX8294971.1 TetR/AcrR family transcriptional regulator [Phyllobacterium sp. 0TCS1.6A]